MIPSPMEDSDDLSFSLHNITMEALSDNLYMHQKSERKQPNSAFQANIDEITLPDQIGNENPKFKV